MTWSREPPHSAHQVRARPFRNHLLVAMAIALMAGAAAASPVFGPLHGISIDALTSLRWFAFAPAHDPAASPAVVIALDEETYRTPPFVGTPGVTWTREIGRVLTAVIDGGAKVVGFDVVYATSIEQSEIPFAGETLGASCADSTATSCARSRAPASPTRSCSD